MGALIGKSITLQTLWCTMWIWTLIFARCPLFFSQIHYENTLNKIMLSLFSSILNFLFHGNNYGFCLHLFITFVRRTLMQAVHNVSFLQFLSGFGWILHMEFSPKLTMCSVQSEVRNVTEIAWCLWKEKCMLQKLLNDKSGKNWINTSRKL